MTLKDNVSLLSKEASNKLLADMLQQAEEDKATLLDALSDARDILASPITAYDQRTWDAVLARARAAIEDVGGSRNVPTPAEDGGAGNQ